MNDERVCVSVMLTDASVGNQGIKGVENSRLKRGPVENKKRGRRSAVMKIGEVAECSTAQDAVDLLETTDLKCRSEKEEMLRDINTRPRWKRSEGGETCGIVD